MSLLRGLRRGQKCVYTVDFRDFIVFFVGPRPWHIEIRHRVKKASTIHLFGFETQIEDPKIEIMETDRMCVWERRRLDEAAPSKRGGRQAASKASFGLLDTVFDYVMLYYVMYHHIKYKYTIML